MKNRTKKIISLFLAASMVFTMNTAAFAEEAVEYVAESAEEETETAGGYEAFEADTADDHEAAVDEVLRVVWITA